MRHAGFLTASLFTVPPVCHTAMQDALDTAVAEAKRAYESTDKSPIDYGFALVKGIDGRTSLAHACRDHPDIDVSNDSYHGTTVTIDGLTRYLMPQQRGYRAFIRVLEENGVDAQDMRVWSHAD